MIGCNVIDPLLRVTGERYSVPITRESLEFLAGLGHRAVEFSHAVHFTDREVTELRTILEDLGLSAWSVHSWRGGDPLATDAEAQFRVGLGRCTQVALGLGATVVVHHPFGSTDAPPLARARLEREAELIELVACDGVRYGLENTSGPDQFQYALDLADLLGADRAGICVDTGHAHIQGPSPAEVILRAGSRLITTHLHDNHGERDEHAPPGDGTLDWDSVVEALRTVEYQGCIMLELTDVPPPERRVGIKDELARGADAARRIAERVHAPPRTQ